MIAPRLVLLLLASALVFFCAAFSHVHAAITNRQYVVGGDFTQVRNSATDVVDSKYVAIWDIAAKKWIAATSKENAPNGPVNAVYIDSCRNLWIGGNFTAVGATKTGPVAVMFRDTATFAPVPLTASMEWSDGAIVHDVYANCVTQASTTPCDRKQCDLYVAGQFSRAGGLAANNVVRYDAKEDKWDNLGGGVAGEAALAVRYTPDDEEVFIGGRALAGGALQRSGPRKTPKWVKAAEVDGEVRSLFIKLLSAGLTDHTLYIGGTFTTPQAKTAKLIVKDRKFEALGSVALSGDVNAIAVGVDDVFAGGSFTSSQSSSVKNAAALRKGRQAWEPLSGIDIPVTAPLNVVLACEKLDAGCSSGDLFLAGVNPNPAAGADAYHGSVLFDYSSGTYTKAGMGANGNILAGSSIFTSSATRLAGAASAMAASAIAALAVMLFIM